MILTQAVKCPYCGYERHHAWSPKDNRGDTHVVTCERNSHHAGCGRQYVLYWHICAVTDTRKIEGQEEQKAAE